jgi:hypothetical protein
VECEEMSRNTMIIMILLVPLAIWLNLYAYYKYGRALIKKMPYRRNREIMKNVNIKNKEIKKKERKNRNIKSNRKR